MKGFKPVKWFYEFICRLLLAEECIMALVDDLSTALDEAEADVVALKADVVRVTGDFTAAQAAKAQAEADLVVAKDAQAAAQTALLVAEGNAVSQAHVDQAVALGAAVKDAQAALDAVDMPPVS